MTEPIESPAVETHTIEPGDLSSPTYDNVGDGPIAKPPKKKKKKLSPGKKDGRPPVVTEEVLRKLLDARADGATIEQSLLIADCKSSTYYDYVTQHPDFSEAMGRAKDILSVLAARKLRKALESKEFTFEQQTEVAWKILDREDKREARRLLPSRQGNVNLNLGTQTIINAEDLTDDECIRLTEGEPLATILGNRQLATAPKE